MRHRAGPLHRANARLQRDLRARITRLETANPEWRPLLAATTELFSLLQGEQPFSRCVPNPALAAEALAAGIPALERARIELDLAAAGRAIRGLAQAAGVPVGSWFTDRALVSLLEAAVLEDVSLLQAPESSAEARAALLVVGRYALISVLHSCAEPDSDPNPAWDKGYCPRCGAWPILAELRGLEQARRLRCGRCAADWAGDLLSCSFCGERDHRRLGKLVPERLSAQRVETCMSCGGYLKQWTTLMPLSAAELLLADLESVELDLAAQAAGSRRPAGVGFPLSLEFVPTTLLPHEA